MSNRSLSIASLIIPIALGGALYLLISGMIDGKIVDSEMAHRYLVGHPISRATTFLFCVGLVALISLLRQVRWQRKSLGLIKFNLQLAEGTLDETTTDDALTAQVLQKQLAKLSGRLQGHSLTERLGGLLGYIARNGSSDGLEGELKYQSELARDDQQQRLSFVKILIWAIPMLGFLGTVIGISQALSQLNVGPENNLQSMMGNLQSSLYVAFDTTAQALVLSMILMFLMFFEERFELQFINQVDTASTSELAKCFEFRADSDQTDVIRRLGKKMLASTRAAVQEHTRIWKKTIESAENAWVQSQSGVSEQMQGDLRKALDESLGRFADQMETIAQRADENLSLRLGQWQTLLSENSRSIEKQQSLNQSHCELMGNVLDNLTNLRTDTNLADQRVAQQHTQMADFHSQMVERQAKMMEQIVSITQRWENAQGEQDARTQALDQSWCERMETITSAIQTLIKQDSERQLKALDIAQLETTLVEIVSVVQMIKEELSMLDESRQTSQATNKKAFQLRIAKPSRNAA